MCSISEFLSDLNRICVTLTNTTREICIFSQTLLNKIWVIYKKIKQLSQICLTVEGSMNKKLKTDYKQNGIN
jgi:superfamily II DNA/RNA helicase